MLMRNNPMPFAAIQCATLLPLFVAIYYNANGSKFFDFEAFALTVLTTVPGKKLL
jgi:hypothetical protein